MVYSSELTIPNQFTDGQVTSASQMNENFAAIQAAVNEINSTLDSIQSSSGTIVQSANKSTFKGFSAGKLDGAAGILALQQQCDNLSAGSRVCFASEVLTSAYNASAVATLPEGGKAWLFPGNLVFEDGFVSISETGITLPLYNQVAGLSCQGWSSNSAQFCANGRCSWGNGALSVNTSLQITTSTCDEKIHVACCK